MWIKQNIRHLAFWGYVSELVKQTESQAVCRGLCPAGLQAQRHQRGRAHQTHRGRFLCVGLYGLESFPDLIMNNSKYIPTSWAQLHALYFNTK